MANDQKKDAPAAEQTITVTPSILKAMFREWQEEERGKEKSYEEQSAEVLRKIRGQDRPLIPEEIVPCRSPLTGSTMTVRVTKSRTTPGGRVVEILDYVRPEGWDKHESDGGLYTGEKKWMAMPEDGNLQKGHYKYRHWLYSSFWMADWNALSGKPMSFLAQWRVAPATDKAAE